MAFTYAPSGADNSATYDVESSSLIRYRESIIDNIFNDHVLLNRLKERDAIVMQTGGASIGVPVEYQENATVKAIDYFDTFDTTPQKISQTAEFQWGVYVGNVSISHKELRQNAGQNIYNVREAYARNLSKSIASKLTTDMFAGSAATNGVNTLVTLIDATSTIGNINSTSQSFWQATSTGSGSFAAQGLSDMETTYNAISASNMSESPDFIVSTSTEFQFYNLALQAQIRYTSTVSADASFQNLMFKTADMSFDKKATAGVMYFINTNALKLYIETGSNFIFVPPVRPSNQVAEASAMLVMLQLVVNNRRRLGKMTSITA